MKFLMLTTAFAVVAGAAIADVTIGVGQEGRGYEAYGKSIAARIEGADIVNFAGSDEISRAVCDGTVGVGIMQADARYQRSQDGCTLRVVGEYPTQEYAFILFPEGSDHDELSDLSDADKVLVDEIGSGTDLFWTTIREIEVEHGNGSSWMNAGRVNDMFLFADGMASSGEIDAVIYVGNPNSEEIKTFLSSGWELGQLWDKDINDMQVDGAPLYGVEDVKIDMPGWFSNQSNDAYVVKSYVAATKEWLAEDRDRARDLALAVRSAE